MRGRVAGRWMVVAALLLTGMQFGWLRAQTPASARDEAAAALPVRRVVLYKSGVGYFEHVGRVRGNQNVSIDFTSGQLDDVLSSLTTMDLDGGRVTGVSYNSDDALDRRLSALRLPVGQVTTRASLLSALRGARVTVGGVSGRLLGVESRTRTSGGAAIQIDSVSVVTDDGAIRNVPLDPGVDVRLLDPDLRRDVGQYMTLMASARDRDQRRLTISANGTGNRDLYVSYVSEVPVWKVTYRLVLPEAGSARSPLLQGWAIIDNTGAQDWANVQLSLVAGAPQSFIQQISRPYYIQRPVIGMAAHAVWVPQTHESAISGIGPGVLSGTVTDNTGAVMPGVTVTVQGDAGRPLTATTTQSGRFRFPNVPSGVYSVTAVLSGFKTTVREGVIVTSGMESVLAFRLEIGGKSETVTVISESPLVDTKKVAAGGSVQWNLEGGGISDLPGNSSAMRYNYDSFQELQAQTQQVAVTAQAMGDLFAYQVRDPVTIRRNQSALIPILSNDVSAEKVSIWTPTAHAAHPLRGVWVTNSTGLTLDGGSFSVIDGQAFAGEGLVNPLKPGERRLLSYASDLGVQVVPRGEGLPEAITKVRFSRGVVTQDTEQRNRTTYVIRNEDTEPRVVILEHPVRPGWTLANGVKPDETTAQWLRFRVPVGAKTTVNFAVDESQTSPSQFSVNNLTDDEIGVFVKGELITPELEAQLRAIQAQKVEVARIADERNTREAQLSGITADQDRVRGNMQALKGSREERLLLEKYVKQLEDQETQIATRRKELETLDADRMKAQAALDAMILALDSGGAPISRTGSARR